MDSVLTDGPTRQLADVLITSAARPLPDSTRRTAQRTLLNAIGAAIAAHRHPAVDIVAEVGRTHGGAGRHQLPGRTDRLDAVTACIAIGTAAHLEDSDDRHPATGIRPGASVLGPAWTLGTERDASGTTVLRAVALGIEAQLRIGLAMSPWHQEDGWDITGTCGVLGAAVTAGLIAGLDTERLASAIGTAASQTLGQREAIGTMIGGFHPGKAGANGLLAVLLSEQGFTGPDDVLEDERGFFRALSPSGAVHERVLDGFGDRWELDDVAVAPDARHADLHELIEPALPGRTDRIVTAVDELDGAAAIDDLIAACTPEEVPA